MLSKVLMNKQFHHPGMPATLANTSSSVVSSSSSNSEADVASIVLALRTLGSFNFDGKFPCFTIICIFNSYRSPFLFLNRGASIQNTDYDGESDSEVSFLKFSI